MPGIVKQEERIADITAKQPASNAEWLRIHNNQVTGIVRESAAFKKYLDGKRMIAYLCKRHPDLADRLVEKEKRNIRSFVKRMTELNRKCPSAKEDCAKAQSATK
ncbi:Uncharacterised protein [uncultured archaeon]|nr:Uncharacterised protein [uncultured archaeon]